MSGQQEQNDDSSDSDSMSSLLSAPGNQSSRFTTPSPASTSRSSCVSEPASSSLDSSVASAPASLASPSHSVTSNRSVASGKSATSGASRLYGRNGEAQDNDTSKSRLSCRETNKSKRDDSDGFMNRRIKQEPITEDTSGSDQESSDNEEKAEQSGSEALGKSLNVDELFGEANDISSEDDRFKTPKSYVGDDDEDDDRDDVDENEKVVNEGKETEEPIPERRIMVEIPKISVDVGSELHFVKLPNFLSVETRPHDKETYEDEIDEEENLDEEGRSRIKLKVENTIRWRESFDKDGNSVKESNTRMVKWSDGSMSLYLGSEIFDVYKQPLVGDHNHLYIRQGSGLQGQAVFRSKLSFRPHSTESFTHRKITLSLAERSQKLSGIKILSQVGDDPDANRNEKIKLEEVKLRQSMREDTKVKKTRERGANSNISSSYLEPDREDGSDDENISIFAIKNKYNKKSLAKNDKAAIYSSDNDSVDMGPKKKRPSQVMSDLEEEDEDDL